MRSLFQSGWFCWLVLMTLFVGCQSQTESVKTKTDTANQGTQASSPAEGVAPVFRDVWPEQKLDFTYRNGREAGELAILETIGGGTAIFDYDRDGEQDLFFPGGGTFENK
ncbi:MAG: hypothetical protein RLO18_28825, partial [Gimesia chilikensis]